MMHERPDGSTLDPLHSLARGMVLGPPLTWGGYKYVPMRGPKGTLTGMDPADDWQWSGELGRRVLDFDGINDYVGFGEPLVPAGDFAIAAWVQYANVDSGHKYWFGQYPDSSGSAVYIGKNYGTTFLFVAGAAGIGVAATTDLVHIVGQRAGPALHLYTNGQWRTSASANETTTVSNAVFGVRAAGSLPFPGFLADPLIYNRALTPAEIQQLADPSNVMLSGLILPPRRRVWPSAVVPLALPDYPDVTNESPYEQDESIVTVAATGGSAPVSYSIEAQSTTAGMLKVTGTLSPDATGVYTENGTYNGEPYYQRGSDSWYIFFDEIMRAWTIATVLNDDHSPCWRYYAETPIGDYTITGYTGTATVAAYEPFEINSSTAEITIADASGLAVGQVWTLTVRATDALLDTDDGTVTVELVGAAAFNPAWAARCNNLIGAGI